VGKRWENLDPTIATVTKKNEGERPCHHCGNISNKFIAINDLKPNLTSVPGVVKVLG